jgi:predicted RNA-binding Zn ribbon-like protein
MTNWLTCQYCFDGYTIKLVFTDMVDNKPQRHQAAAFELIGGNVSLDFINTLDDRGSEQPKELLPDYYALARFGEESGILTRAQFDYLVKHIAMKPDEARKAMRSAINLREALYEVFMAVLKKQTAPQPAMERLNAYLHDAALHSRLVQTRGRLEWRFDEVTSSFDAMLWPIAQAAGKLLASPELARVRACSSPTCQWVFLDTSKNHKRRWCSMEQCGNRAKVRKFYARQKSAS